MRNTQLRGGSTDFGVTTAADVGVIPTTADIKNTRLELRVTSEFKEKVRSASSFLGVDMSSFIAMAANELAEQTLEKQRLRMLSETAWKRLNELMTAPAKDIDDDLTELVMRKRKYVRE
ncbi:DUF1778 domain-containing protein [Pantoea sp. 9140]|uniref:type II toxin-antitoxin system TacA family antitoxin n=1 Tax=Pantoea sp. 9140 TaxID=1500896 RepID=UPI000534F8A8|nr:DUF1778 domain-containing protein [Pantoea sp. 9140]